MKDGIIKADGTSRLVRSVPDFKNRYPSYDAFAAAMAAGTIPMDILFNKSGWSQLPDFLNKENLLKDSTAARYGLAEDAVPDNVFSAILSEINGKASIKLLWENASPLSNFDAQTIELNLTEYDAVIITAIGDNDTIQYIVNPLFLRKGEKGELSSRYYRSYNSMQVRVVEVFDTGVKFHAGYGGNANRTGVLMPNGIYGIKGVS